MRVVFADTLYWYGFANSRDQWHTPVLRARSQLDTIQLVTTDEVLVEFLTAMSCGGVQLRRTGVELVQSILADRSVQVFPQTSYLLSSQA